jgi:hypothetical protein
MQSVFPTRYKNRIAHTVSYPLTAKEISEALSDVPQADRLTISFWLYEPMDQRGKPRDILVVRYAGEARVRTEPPINDQWSISVAPVARAMRHQINGRLKEEALPAIRAWLIERENLYGRFGGQSLSAIFDEKAETLKMVHFQTPGETFSM